MNTSFTYDVDLAWTGARHGDLRAVGLPVIEVGAPPEFKGHEGIWTPEHLLVGAVTTCFMTTFLAIAELSKLEFVNVAVTATGRLEKVEGHGFLVTEIAIRPRVTLRNEDDASRALRILEKAERNCFISNSINAAIRLEPELLSDEARVGAVEE
jgi:peroxiredoxin-like protein